MILAASDRSSLLLSSAVDDSERARLHASLTASSGAWLQALPISSCGWTTTSSGWRWVCVSALTCVSHTRAHAVSSWMPVARTGWAASEVQDVTPATACSTTSSCGMRCCEPRCRPARSHQVSAGQTVSVRTGSRSSPGLVAAA